MSLGKAIDDRLHVTVVEDRPADGHRHRRRLRIAGGDGDGLHVDRGARARERAVRLRALGGDEDLDSLLEQHVVGRRAQRGDGTAADRSQGAEL